MTMYHRLVTKDSVVQRIASEQTFNDILNSCCDLDREYSNPALSQNTLAYDDLQPNYSWMQKNY